MLEYTNAKSFEFVGEIDNSNGMKVRIWRPIPPMGFYALGDVARVGNDPPSSHSVIVFRDDRDFTSVPSGLTPSTTLKKCKEIPQERILRFKYYVWPYYEYPPAITSCTEIKFWRLDCGSNSAQFEIFSSDVDAARNVYRYFLHSKSQAYCI